MLKANNSVASLKTDDWLVAGARIPLLRPGVCSPVSGYCHNLGWAKGTCSTISSINTTVLGALYCGKQKEKGSTCLLGGLWQGVLSADAREAGDLGGACAIVAAQPLGDGGRIQLAHVARRCLPLPRGSPPAPGGRAARAAARRPRRGPVACATIFFTVIIIITRSANPKPEAIGHTRRASAAFSAGPTKVCSLSIMSSYNNHMHSLHRLSTPL